MKRILSVFVMGIILAGCSKSTDKPEVGVDAAGKPLTVAVVNYPLAYFTERIAGDTVTVMFPVPADIDPAFWKPSEAEIREYQQADLILLNGADYAKWLKIATLPGSKTVNTTKGVSYIINKNGVTHTHGPQGAHEHGETAFTTWIDPSIALRQAQTVRDALIKLLPESQKILQSNFDSLRNDLNDLAKQLDEYGNRLGDQPLIGSHPVYHYLTACLGLNMRSLHWEPGEMPSDNEWDGLEEMLKTYPAKIMIWEDDPLPEIAERVTAYGLKCITFSPCGNRPSKGDYLSVMRDNLENFN